MKVISVLSGPGGVGKTTVATLLAYSLTKRGFRVLLIDTDPSAGLSMLLLPERELEELEKLGRTLPNALEAVYSEDREGGQRVRDCIRSGVKFYDAELDVIPSSPELSEFLGRRWYDLGDAAEEPLRSLLDRISGLGLGYDVVLIDSIPFYEARYTRMTCRASQYRVVVTTPRYLDVRRTNYMVKRLVGAGRKGGGIIKVEELSGSFKLLVNKVPAGGDVRELVERGEWWQLGLGEIIERYRMGLFKKFIPDREAFAIPTADMRRRVGKKEPDFLKVEWRISGRDVKGGEIVGSLTSEVVEWLGLRM
jgi:chromosome partitioning protein